MLFEAQIHPMQWPPSILDGGLGYIVNCTFNYSDSFPTSPCEEIRHDEDSTIERPLQSVFHFEDIISN